MYCLIVFKFSGFIAKSAIRQLFLIDVLLNKTKALSCGLDLNNWLLKRLI